MNRLRSLKSSVPAVKSTSISLKKLKDRIRELAATNKLRLQSLFSDQVVNELARELGHDFRERVFDPATTLGLYVAQVLNRDELCSTVVVRFTIRAPDTDANQLEFPQPTSQEPGLGYPTIRVVTLTSLAAKVVTHFQYGTSFPFAHESNPYWNGFAALHNASQSSNDFAWEYGQTNAKEDWSTVWELYFGYNVGPIQPSSVLRAKLALVDAFFDSPSNWLS